MPARLIRAVANPVMPETNSLPIPETLPRALADAARPSINYRFGAWNCFYDLTKTFGYI